MIRIKKFRRYLYQQFALLPGRNWIDGLSLLSRHLKSDTSFTRKGFLGFCLVTFMAFFIGCDREKEAPSGTDDTDKSITAEKALLLEEISPKDLHEASYYRQLDAEITECELCFRRCVIEDGAVGACLARINISGILYTLTYGKPVAVYVDPLEKAPFLHVYPGSDALSLGTASCNLRCKNCINWQFAFKAPGEVEAVSMAPETVVQTALSRNIRAICFTYNEPTVQYEYMYDIAAAAKAENMTVALHSNGMISPEPLEALLPLVDAVVVDLKAFNDRLYRELTGGELAPVLQTLQKVHKTTWLEIVCLLIPTVSDNLEDIEAMCRWISENLGQEVPVHFSRFFPSARLTQLPPTPVTLLEQACEIAENTGLKFVYINNIPGHDKTDTYCPACAERIIHRRGLFIQENNIDGSNCAFCGHEIAGIW
ncbi:MAG: hypothetical protein AVO34_12100 [Firmicutes bacterium ML8_F2]|nr:MAG: hypothetical protein AVO34_12100 [Firmicutes bacterium ML8_F2]